MGSKRARRLSALDGAHIVAVAEPYRPTRDAFARSFGVQLAVSDFRRLIADPAVDVVCVCSPPITHSVITIEALTAGKHVICESPMAVSAEQAEEMMVAAEVSGRKLFVTMPQRYMATNQQTARIISEGEIGYPFLTLVTYIDNEYDRLNDWHDWEGTWDLGGGGILMLRGPEAIDLLHSLHGQIEAVSAVCTRFAIEALNKAEDSCVLGIEFTEEATAQLVLTGAARYSAWPPDYAGSVQRVEIYGLNGSIFIANTGEPSIAVVARGNKRREMFVSEISTELPTDMERDFLDSIAMDKESLVTAEDALIALKVVLAAYKSSQMKRRVESFEMI
jgi:predicted dehydrogenase